jgi:hypothetical protein
VWKGPAWLTVLRDLVCLVAGVLGLAHEELSPHPNLQIMAFFGLLMTAPSLLGAWLLGRTGTLFSAPPSPPPSLSPSSPSPTTPGAGEP